MKYPSSLFVPSSLFILIICQLLVSHVTLAAPAQDPQETDLYDLFSEALEDSRYNIAIGEIGEAATRLFGWQGCSASQKKDIYSGWQQSWKLMDAAKGSNLKWNEAAALDYLAPPFVNEEDQTEIQKIIDTVATIQGGSSLNPFKWWLHVRCDDPQNRCPCGSVTSTIAYTTDRDADSGYARINFCPRYFNLPNLDDAVKEHSRRELPLEHRADLDNYARNKGRTWYHELLHIDWASGVLPGWHIRDMEAYYYNEDNSLRYAAIYGAERTKALARYKFSPPFFIRRNADNFAMYAVAKYVQKVIGKYPHLPLAFTLDSVEDGTGIFRSGGIAIDPEGKVTIAEPAEEEDACELFSLQASLQEGAPKEDVPEEDIVPFNSSASFTGISDYPEDYQRQWRGWVADASPYHNRVRIVWMQSETGPQWVAYQDTPDAPITDFCSAEILSKVPAEGDESNLKFPIELPAFDAHEAKGCIYSGTSDIVGGMTCGDGSPQIRCWEDPEWHEMSECTGGRYMLGIKCDWE